MNNKNSEREETHVKIEIDDRTQGGISATQMETTSRNANSIFGDGR